MPATAPGLRERNKAKRRDAIVDATLELLRAHPIEDVSIERIAALAEVAPATVYNLVGSREGVLLACLDRLVDRLVERLVELGSTEDPVELALAVVDESAEMFIADGQAYRQVLGELGDVSRSGSRLAVDAGQLQIAAMRDAQSRGVLRADLDPAAVGRQVYVSYNGALYAWAGRCLSDDGFRFAARHGLWTALAAAAADAHRDRFVAELRDLGPRLTAAGWGVE